MKKPDDLTLAALRVRIAPGVKRSMLTAIRRTRLAGNSRMWMWLFRCDCGTEKELRSAEVMSLKTKSCGCFRKSSLAITKRKHGGVGTPEYGVWAGMLARCCNTNDKNYHRRGISVCAEWGKDFGAFLSHVGKRPSPSHSIDRIDNNGNYEPGNVRWATRRTQSVNRRSTILVTIGGATKSVSEWAATYRISPSCCYDRIRRGWSPEDAVRTPPRAIALDRTLSATPII